MDSGQDRFAGRDLRMPRTPAAAIVIAQHVVFRAFRVGALGRCGEGRSPNLCLAGPAATGDCFTGANESTNSTLHVGGWVAVAFTRGSGVGPAGLSNVDRVPAAAHRDDCPSGLTPGRGWAARG
jgi:hypothetical protein